MTDPNVEAAGGQASRFRPRPAVRRLRAFAYDPGLAARLSTVALNETVLPVAWEEDLLPGPIGEYLEVIDHDPASGVFYEPVDLNEPHLLAQDGLAPSEGNPHFHQQMVYAVGMTTIRHFEQALGRRALWAPRRMRQAGGEEAEEYVPRLRIYPHALREANAYYSPAKKALLFGYFTAAFDGPGTYMPGGMVFTCLSHDIIAHEMTHALLDGLHPLFIEVTNPDVLALHEAFADVVALFQHFANPEVLAHQLAETRGDLARRNLLGKLARQFGEAIGNRGALRDAIGPVDRATGAWQPHAPPAAHRRRAGEAHQLGLRHLRRRPPQALPPRPPTPARLPLPVGRGVSDRRCYSIHREVTRMPFPLLHLGGRDSAPHGRRPGNASSIKSSHQAWRAGMLRPPRL